MECIDRWTAAAAEWSTRSAASVVAAASVAVSAIESAEVWTATIDGCEFRPSCEVRCIHSHCSSEIETEIEAESERSAVAAETLAVVVERSVAAAEELAVAVELVVGTALVVAWTAAADSNSMESTLGSTPNR